METAESILDRQAISGRYLFPQPRRVVAPFVVQVDGAELACYRQISDPANFTAVFFHGNGEAVADYLPWMADEFSNLGLNSLFVEYRQYGGSTGKAHKPILVRAADGLKKLTPDDADRIIRLVVGRCSVTLDEGVRPGYELVRGKKVRTTKDTITL